jgi:hypothetical protein
MVSTRPATKPAPRMTRATINQKKAPNSSDQAKAKENPEPLVTRARSNQNNPPSNEADATKPAPRTTPATINQKKAPNSSDQAKAKEKENPEPQATGARSNQNNLPSIMPPSKTSHHRRKNVSSSLLVFDLGILCCRGALFVLVLQELPPRKNFPLQKKTPNFAERFGGRGGCGSALFLHGFSRTTQQRQPAHTQHTTYLGSSASGALSQIRPSSLRSSITPMPTEG